MFYVTKTYDHSLGLSACFRQHRAQSHCRFLHGYALSFKLVFGADKLNENNWVIDFGGLKPVKQWLCDTFDHKMVVAADDPAMETLFALMEGEHRLAEIQVFEDVGCEAFAREAHRHVNSWLEHDYGQEMASRGLHLKSVEVREHGGNSAIYEVVR